MADDNQFGMQELASARYMVHADESIGSAVEATEACAAAPATGIENTFRWVTTLVILMLMGTVGGLCWQKRASIASSFGELKKRNSAVDVLLWAGGSKKTFKEGFSDMLNRSQRDSAFPIDQKKPAFKTEFDNVDFQNLSQSWNGGKR